MCVNALSYFGAFFAMSSVAGLFPVALVCERMRCNVMSVMLQQYISFYVHPSEFCKRLVRPMILHVPLLMRVVENTEKGIRHGVRISVTEQSV